MEKVKFNLKKWFGAIVFVCILQGCTSFMLKEPGEIHQERGSIALAIEGTPNEYWTDGIFLKSGINTDTNSYILSIYSTEGEKIYDGAYGGRPEEITVTPGGYEIALYSQRFNPPSLDTPVFGDTHTIVVSENEQAKVSFICRQINAGIKLAFSDGFKAKFPGSGVIIAQGKKRLQYDYEQKKYAYVSAEPFQIIYNNSGVDTTLLEKTLDSGQMLSMRLEYNASKSTASVFKIDIDTARVWFGYNYNVGLKIPTGAVSIEEAKEMIGQKNVKVFGYILGGDVTTTTVRVGPPFEMKSSFVIASSVSERNRNNMMVVELPSGPIRDALNLVNNPDNLGRPIVVTGTIVSAYYGYPGIKSTKSYTLL